MKWSGCSKLRDGGSRPRCRRPPRKVNILRGPSDELKLLAVWDRLKLSWLDVQSRELVDWIEFESSGFDCPSFADELVGCEAFASAEYPCCVGSFIDGFGLFLNGANIAFAGGNPVNIDNPDMVNTAFPTDGGNDGSSFQTTALGGVLVENGSAVITYGGNVIPGSTNTLTFIVADANDDELDTAAFIQGLGNAPRRSARPSRRLG
jgi:hypothetical protein